MRTETKKKIAQKLLDDLNDWITISKHLYPLEIKEMQKSWVESVELCLAECDEMGQKIASLQAEIIGYRARNARYCSDNCYHARYAKKHKLQGGLNHMCAECPLKEPVIAEEMAGSTSTEYWSILLLLCRRMPRKR